MNPGKPALIPSSSQHRREDDDMTAATEDGRQAGPLAGRRALVTGASRGIGSEIVRRLTADGAAVAFTYGASAAEADKLVAEVAANGGSAVAIQADSADPDQVANAVDETVSRFGGLDILVNNAGVAYIGSINADRVPVPGLSVYAMTKAAVAGLTRGLARELGPRGITVNNIQPGPIATDMNPAEGEFADAAMQVIALGHYGHPRDIASAVSYLAGPESAFITGADWDIDGGFAA
jgi:3-oxoacyl-[acyl-carrier protein] reductase